MIQLTVLLANPNPISVVLKSQKYFQFSFRLSVTLEAQIRIKRDIFVFSLG